jgi:hypothetical protein
MILSKTRLYCLFALMPLIGPFLSAAQQVTGIWEGKINNNRVEVKIIQKGDSLTGTSYYYNTAHVYRRYTIKGYFDAQTNEVVWWDDQLITSQVGSPGKIAQLSVADFNCPGGGAMSLDGKAAPKEDRGPKGNVNLVKTEGSSFSDEWDYVIRNYTVGANDPDVIDSVGLIAMVPVRVQQPAPQVIEEIQKTPPPVIAETKKEPVLVLPPPVQTIEEKFTSRKKVFTKEIPVEGDSVELRFYDNAEIDGDSISLFLNDQLIFSHVRLTDKAYSIKVPVNELKEDNELIMVAENLGTIPPNTSYMVAIVGENRYDAYLASTENSSAMIRLKKTTDHRPQTTEGRSKD